MNNETKLQVNYSKNLKSTAHWHEKDRNGWMMGINGGDLKLLGYLLAAGFYLHKARLTCPEKCVPFLKQHKKGRKGNPSTT